MHARSPRQITYPMSSQSNRKKLVYGQRRQSEMPLAYYPCIIQNIDLKSFNDSYVYKNKPNYNLLLNGCDWPFSVDMIRNANIDIPQDLK